MKPWACYTCRSVKMKCVPSEDGGACRRCRRLGHDCRFPSSSSLSERPHGDVLRRRRSVQRRSIIQVDDSTSPSDESTLDRIEYLERQLNTLIASKNSEDKSGKTAGGTGRANNGRESKMKSAKYYDEFEYCQFLEQGKLSLLSQVQEEPEQESTGVGASSPLDDNRNEDQMGRAAILDTGLITMQEAEQLFTLFYDHYAPALPILDKERHSPEETLRKSTTLFTAICAVGSRSYKPRPELSDKIALAAELAAAQMIIVCDCRSAQTVQALFIIAHWPRPSNALAASKSLLYSGMALRIGPEVCKFKGILSAEDNASYERLWLQFYTFDMLLSIQNARPPTLATNKVLIDYAETWWGRPGAAIYDVLICASVRLFYVLGVHVVDLAKASTLTSSSERQAGTSAALAGFKTAFDSWSHIWAARIKSMEQYLTPMYHITAFDKSAFSRLQSQLHFHSAYTRLAIYSIALRSSTERSPSSSTATTEKAINREYYIICRDLAQTILSTVLPASGGESSRYLDLNFSDEADVSMASFAALYLRNLAKMPLAEPGALAAANQQIADLIDLLGQTPFLRSIREQQIKILSLALHQQGGSEQNSTSPRSPPSSSPLDLVDSREAQSVLQSALDDQYWQSLFFSPEKLQEAAAFSTLMPTPMSMPKPARLV